jgi:hypothetical protein
VTLLEEALKVRTGGKAPVTVTDEQVELLVAFLRGEVTYGQAGVVLRAERSQGVAAKSISLLRRAVALGKLKVEVVK